MEQLLNVLRTVKDRATGPILIHAITQKVKDMHLLRHHLINIMV